AGSNSAEFWYVPSITHGCSACRISARRPPTNSTGSRCTRHVSDCGPNNPVSVSVGEPEWSTTVDGMRIPPALQHP
ncbi:MAG: hypothetical protein K0R87_2955, partial [Pseudonocardia sp.]|nr:hypothetical protein [Pseudonocardia sp.]